MKILTMIDRTKVFSSSVKLRSAYLEELKNNVESNGLDSDEKLALLSVLLSTYNYFQDNKSRLQVEQILLLFFNDNSYVELILDFILPISSSLKSMALTDLLTLLGWTNLLVERVPLSNEKLYLCYKNLLRLCMCPPVSKQNKSREERTTRSVVSKCKYSLSKALTTEVIDIIIGDFDLNVVGIMMDSVVDLQPVKPELFNYVEQKIDVIIKKFNDVIASNFPKSLPEEYTFKLLEPFFSNFITAQNVMDIFNSIDKLIMKSSEVSLAFLVPQVVTKVNSDCFQAIADSKFITKVLNGLKNAKENIRQGCYVTLNHLKFSNYNDLLELSKTGTVESKVLILKLLTDIDIKKEEKGAYLDKLAPVLKKDINELTLPYLINSFIFNYFDLEMNQTYQNMINEGLKHKRLNVRRLWFISIAEYVDSLKTIDQITDKIAPLDFQTTVKEFTTSPLLMVNNKGIACIFITIILVKKFNLDIDLSKVYKNDKFSIISVNIFNKLTEEHDVVWGAKFLTVCDEYTGDYGLCWAYLLCSSNVSNDYKFKNVKVLDDSDTEGKISSEIINAIFDYLHRGCSDDLNINKKFILSVLKPLSKLHVSIKLTLIANYFSTDTKSFWVPLAQANSIDLEKFTTEHFDEIYKLVSGIFADRKSGLYKSAVKSFCELCFITPKLAVPKFLESLKDLDTSFDDISVQIWQNESPIPVINPIKNSKVELNKNSKNYETEKWESELKKELKKISKEDQKLISDRLKVEQEIKSQVQTKIDKLNTYFDLVNELCLITKSFDTQQEIWYLTVINNMTVLFDSYNIINQVTNNGLHDCILKLSELLPDNTQAERRPRTAKALIKLCNEEFDFDTATDTILFLQGESSRGLHDVVAVSFCLPLIIKTLEVCAKIQPQRNYKPVSEYSEEDPQQFLANLSLEYIQNTASVFSNNLLPRKRVVELVIKYLTMSASAKIAKNCLGKISESISLNCEADDLQAYLNNLITPDVSVKKIILEVIDLEFELPMETSNEIWISCNDTDEGVAELAATIWTENKLVVKTSTPYEILEKHSSHEESGLRLSIAKSIVTSVIDLKQTSADFLDKYLDFVYKFYDTFTRPPPPKLDEFGLVIKSSVTNKDRWETRSTIALSLKELTPEFNQEQIVKNFEFLINQKALNDQNDLVRQELQDFGTEMVKQFQLPELQAVIPLLEKALDSTTEVNIKESAVIIYGSLAGQLSADDSRVEVILETLISTLKTPNENVQIAIAKCLSTFSRLLDKKVLEGHFERLFEDLFNETSDVKVRTGAAYGIVGLVKGVGIKALQDFDIMRSLDDAVEDKRSAIKRESVAVAYGAFSSLLGKFFEPYVIQILPTVLKLLGDQSPEVRAAADKSAKTIMRHTTSFGIKKLIPLAISNLDDIAWRSKKGAVELLGTMAYLDPAQLSSSLSSIVPEIIGVLNDSHKEVRKAADLALKRFGEVIRNPEIHEIVPDLIKAIGDPTKYTEEALIKLTRTKFVHYIDGPSLALIIFVIKRGMYDRSTTIKCHACRIVGNMALLVDAKDIMIYLNPLMEGLETVMVDPVPEARSNACRALGSLAGKLGEHQLPGLIPKLLGNLQDETKVSDRLGSAEALAEVIYGLGLSKLEELLPTVLSNSKSPKTYIRAGFLPLLYYLPLLFQDEFSPYLRDILPPLLSGLADADEEIRSMALQGGTYIVSAFSSHAVELFLPELEKGMNDVDHRIRLSSVKLTSDVLRKVSGTSPAITADESEEFEVTKIHKKFITALGLEHRDKVMALLFICRNDVNTLVRNEAIETWKMYVSNTPKMIKEVLPTLTKIIIKKLASDEEVEKTIAATTMGDVVKRVGAANSLTQILPNLLELLDSDDSSVKEGVCIATNELIKSSNDQGLQEFQDTFIKIVRKTLTDESAEVRASAAIAFDTLQGEIGKKVIDDIIPDLLNMLNSGESEFALLALQDIMSTKSDIIFPILIPTLLSPPIDKFKVGALSSLASVAGNALYRKLTLIINTLVDLIVSSDEEDKEFIKVSLDKILCSINDQDGVNPLMQTLLLLTKHEDYQKRAVVFERLGEFFKNTNLDYSIYLSDMIQSFILSLGDKSIEVVKGTFEALSAIVGAQSKDTLEKLVKPAQQSLMLTGVKGEELEAFKFPKGPNCILPIFLQGLMYGNSEQRELSASGIADIIGKTPSDNLRPFSTTITGPLIRVIGEKVNSNVKASILVAINNLLIKIPQFLRPFIPQLQRTFVRLLSDPSNDDLRNRAVEGLGILIKFQPRIDSLIIELISGCKNSDVEEIKLTMLKAILEIVQKAGDKLNESSKQNIMNLIEDEFTNVKGKVGLQYAKLLGTLSKILTVEETESIMKTKILTKDPDQYRFAIIGLNAFLKESPAKLVNLLDAIVDFLVQMSVSVDAFIGDNATLAIGKLLLSEVELEQDHSSKLVHQLCKVMNSETSSESKRYSIIILRTCGRLKYQYIQPDLDTIVPSVFNHVRSMIIPIKLSAEKCFMSVLKLSETEKIFDEWIATKGDNIEVEELNLKFVKRSISDYTKRVALRLAKIENERIEQGGDEETLFSDRIEDEQEIWSIGGI